MSLPPGAYHPPRVVCARCGAVKGESNRWWLLRLSGRMLQILPLTRLPNKRMFKTVEQAICGGGCVVKEVSEFLGRGIE